MRKNNSFVEFENLKEFEKWFKEFSISRNIVRLQVHQIAKDCYHQLQEVEL